MSNIKNLPIFQVSYYDKEPTNIGCIWVTCHSEAVKLQERYQYRNKGLVAEIEEYGIDLTKKFIVDFLNKVAGHGLVVQSKAA